MRTWNIKAEDPLTLTYAMDARLGLTDYCDDHIWELSLAGGDPPALAIQTTYGLRARSLRLFPRFTEGGITLSDPASFVRPPILHIFSPNYSRLSFYPFMDIEVIHELWIPESHAITGRMHITNRGVANRHLRLEWAAILNPTSEGQRFTPIPVRDTMILSGSTGNLKPVVQMNGVADAITSPFPAFVMDILLPMEAKRTVSWVEASLTDMQASINLATEVAGKNWDAEIARIALINSGQVEIFTGNSDWDIAFALAQKNALGLFIGPTSHLPAVSIGFTKQSDGGYSPIGDGSDYNHLWSGQTPIDVYYLAGILLPAYPHLVQGLLLNFLATQSPEGKIDCKPGLGGQRSQILATPLLAGLAWNLFSISQDTTFLRKIFPQLLDYFHNWFSPEHDRDKDGIPEWDHILQTGYDDHPLFSHWYTWSRGIDSSVVENPSLCAFLYHECQALTYMAMVLERDEPLLALRAHAENLRAAVESSWDDENATYRYWDRDTHRSPAWEVLAERYGSGEVRIGREFEQPVRINIRIFALDESRRNVSIFIHGTGIANQHLVEKIPPERLRWYFGLGSVTSERVYTNIEDIAIQGVAETDRVVIQIVGFDSIDQTILLPLWAGIPGKERADLLINNTILNRDKFWQPFGIRACASPLPLMDGINPGDMVHLHWNTYIGEGLVNYGYRTEAAELISRIMSAVILNLKQGKEFRKYYDAYTGIGGGDRNALSGLAPVGLFLHILGVKIVSPAKVEIIGINPYPWPVTVKYRGLTVLRQNDKTTVIFPNSQIVSLEGTEKRIIALE